MGELAQGVSIFDQLKDSVGLALSLMIVFNGVVFYMYLMEKKDRRLAWKAHNENLQKTYEALMKFSEAITTLTEVVRASGPRNGGM